MEFCIRTMRLVAILIVLGIASGVHCAERRGQLRGTVTDPSGAAFRRRGHRDPPDGPANNVQTNGPGRTRSEGLRPASTP